MLRFAPINKLPILAVLGLISMQKFLMVLSLILQLFYLWALVVLILAIIDAISFYNFDDPKLMAGVLSQSIVLSVFKTIPGLIGLLISWRIVVKSTIIPEWFRSVTKLYSYLWLLFIPIGTVLGLIQLKVLKNET